MGKVQKRMHKSCKEGGSQLPSLETLRKAGPRVHSITEGFSDVQG